jgi:hypothetical protein
MNTFLTATLVDVLTPGRGPVDGLDDAVERARRHLVAQIESDGLVRYHGLAGCSSIIGTLGCASSPRIRGRHRAGVWRVTGLGAG